MKRNHQVLWLWLVCGALIAATLVTYWSALRNDFINYDDPDYVTANDVVQQGLSWEGVAWAFTTGHASNWHPLTWVSHMADVTLFGLKPWGHHLTNLLFHGANSVLLLLLLRQMTGAMWRSTFVAALFALHPLHVESVAWVAERKDLLSAFFGILTLMAYVHYANEFKAQGPRSKVWYGVALGLFACGLMCKPMLVTWPFVMLLMDFWPLNRIMLDPKVFSLKSWRLNQKVILEKLPFLLLTIVSSIITLVVQRGAMVKTELLAGEDRLGNAILAYANYLGQTIWPVKLAVFYPFPEHFPIVEFSIAIAILIAISMMAIRLARSQPSVIVGWLWFLGTLVPVIGLVQVGEQARADRYTYLPLIGIFFALSWGLSGLAAKRFFALRWPITRIPFGILASVLLVALAMITQRQVGVWRNTEILFAHANKVTTDNYVALAAQADVEIANGMLVEAAKTVERIIRIKSGFPRGQCLMATVLQMQGRMAEAIPYLQRSVGPEVAHVARARMVLSLIDTGRLSEADRFMDELLLMLPTNPDAWLMKAGLLREQGRIEESLDLFRKITEVYEPKLQDTPLFNFELAELYCLDGQSEKAKPFYEKALSAYPNYLNALNNYAWSLSTESNDYARDGKHAIELARRACEVSHWSQPVAIGTLAAAYAESQRFEDAVKMAELARDKAKMLGALTLAERNSELAELYRQGRPYREKAR